MSLGVTVIKNSFVRFSMSLNKIMEGAIKKESDFQVQFPTPENQTSCLGE